MQLFRLLDHFDPDFGEWIVGTRQTGRHGVYLVAGELEEGQSRRLDLGSHEEILLLLSGAARLEGGDGPATLGPDDAVYLAPGTVATLSALSACRYLCAGGHPTAHEQAHG